MYEVIILACTFANAYSTDLVCEEQRMGELPACHVEISDPNLYHPVDNPRGTIFIKSVECKKQIPVAPKPPPGAKNA